jgi:hypothetical protein
MKKCGEEGCGCGEQNPIEWRIFDILVQRPFRGMSLRVEVFVAVSDGERQTNQFSISSFGRIL